MFIEILSSKISEVKKGVIVKIKYYNIDAYDEITGMVSDFDEIYKTLSVIKTKINFENNSFYFPVEPNPPSPLSELFKFSSNIHSTFSIF